MQLSDYFRAQADWRRGKAEQYPTDAGNLQSAEALDSLAEFVEPTGHGTSEAGSAADALAPFLNNDGLGGQKTAREIVRYGYGFPVSVSTHERFLLNLLSTCLVDTYDYAREHEEDPTGALYNFELEAALAEVPLPPSYWQVRPGDSEDELRPVVAAFRDIFMEMIAKRSEEVR